MRVVITNEKDNESHVKEVDSYSDAGHWITNHLDLSKNWQVQDITPASRIKGIGFPPEADHHALTSE